MLWLIGATFLVGLGGMALVQMESRPGELPEGPMGISVNGNWGNSGLPPRDLCRRVSAPMVALPAAQGISKPCSDEAQRVLWCLSTSREEAWA